MKIFLLTILLSTQVFGFAVTSKKVTATGGSPIPTSYSSSNSQSLALQDLASKAKICVINDTTSRIAFNVDAPDTPVAPANDERDVYLPAGAFICMDLIGLGKRVYIRSDELAIVAGRVMLTTW